MKIRINILLPVCLALMMLACTSGLPDNDNRQKPQGEGEPVELSFKLYEASLTKALGATTLVDLDPSTKFTVLLIKPEQLWMHPHKITGTAWQKCLYDSR